MSWLVSDGQVLASLEVADGFASRARGLLGRNAIDGALLLRPARGVHTVGMRFPVDVAYCDRSLRVIDVVTMQQHRIGRPRWTARAVLEAQAGSFQRWGIHPGMVLEVRP
jgi:uncharacterized membrane protein (UPF0127 family)